MINSGFGPVFLLYRTTSIGYYACGNCAAGSAVLAELACGLEDCMPSVSQLKSNCMFVPVETVRSALGRLQAGPVSMAAGVTHSCLPATP